MPPKPKVLLTRLLPESAVTRLAAACDLDVNREDRPLTPGELFARVRGIDGLLCLLTDTVDGRVMDSAGGGLKVIANYAVGYNNVDVPAATARKIPVTNTPDVLTDATADLAWALIMGTMRRVAEGDRAMRAGVFRGWAPLYMLGGEVTGATLGLYGLGRIGRAVARRAAGFRMRTRYHDPAPAGPDQEQELGAEQVGFETLISESDIVSIHVPLTEATRHRFTLAEFAKMKRTAHLVNTSRGGIVKEDDLVAALKQGLIAGAGLDVYEREPHLAPGLGELPNVVLAPHLGSATLPTRTAMARIAVDNVLAALEGRRPPTAVNPEVF
jgi:glyoxylate reductase